MTCFNQAINQVIHIKFKNPTNFFFQNGQKMRKKEKAPKVYQEHFFLVLDALENFFTIKLSTKSCVNHLKHSDTS